MHAEVEKNILLVRLRQAAGFIFRPRFTNTNWRWITVAVFIVYTRELSRAAAGRDTPARHVLRPNTRRTSSQVWMFMTACFAVTRGTRRGVIIARCTVKKIWCHFTKNIVKIIYKTVL